MTLRAKSAADFFRMIRGETRLPAGKGRIPAGRFTKGPDGAYIIGKCHLCGEPTYRQLSPAIGFECFKCSDGPESLQGRSP